MNIHFVASNKPAAQRYLQELAEKYGQAGLADAGTICAIGGRVMMEKVCTMKSATISVSLNDMQRMFSPRSAFSEAMRKWTCEFWERQAKLLDGMQDLTVCWFERRHVGIHAALEATERMCKAETPIELFREYQDWAGGAYQRVMADWFACQKHFVESVGALGPWIPAEENGKTSKPETVPAPARAA